MHILLYPIGTHSFSPGKLLTCFCLDCRTAADPVIGKKYDPQKTPRTNLHLGQRNRVLDYHLYINYIHQLVLTHITCNDDGYIVVAAL